MIKAERLGQPGNPTIPIYLTASGLGVLEYAKEVVGGWLGASLTPERGARRASA